MLFFNFIFIGLAIILLGAGVFGAACMKEGRVPEFGATKNIAAGILYFGGIILFYGLIAAGFGI